MSEFDSPATWYAPSIVETPPVVLEELVISPEGKSAVLQGFIAGTAVRHHPQSRPLTPDEYAAELRASYDPRSHSDTCIYSLEDWTFNYLAVIAYSLACSKPISFVAVLAELSG